MNSRHPQSDMLLTMVGGNGCGGYKSFWVHSMPTHIKHHRMTRFSRIAPILTIRGYFFVSESISKFSRRLQKNHAGCFHQFVSP